MRGKAWGTRFEILAAYLSLVPSFLQAMDALRLSRASEMLFKVTPSLAMVIFAEGALVAVFGLVSPCEIVVLAALSMMSSL